MSHIPQNHNYLDDDALIFWWGKEFIAAEFKRMSWSILDCKPSCGSGVWPVLEGTVLEFEAFKAF
jgi:hypothetical protein